MRPHSIHQLMPLYHSGQSRCRSSESRTEQGTKTGEKYKAHLIESAGDYNSGVCRFNQTDSVWGRRTKLMHDFTKAPPHKQPKLETQLSEK